MALSTWPERKSMAPWKIGVVGVFISTNALSGLTQFQFVATSPTAINPGESVSFSLVTGYITDILRNDVYPADSEPGPIFIGDQSWYRGGGTYESSYYNHGTAQISSTWGHTLSSAIGGNSTLSFSLTFPEMGDYTVSAGGSYVVTDSYHDWYGYSTRGCFFWICGGWEYHNPNYSAYRDYNGIFPTQSLVVQVVPEPATWVSTLLALPIFALRFSKRRLG